MIAVRIDPTRATSVQAVGQLTVLTLQTLAQLPALLAGTIE